MESNEKPPALVETVPPPAAKTTPDGELTDAQLKSVSGGQAAFTSVSNVLKTRHDTAKNSISNIR